MQLWYFSYMKGCWFTIIGGRWFIRTCWFFFGLASSRTLQKRVLWGSSNELGRGQCFSTVCDWGLGIQGTFWSALKLWISLDCYRSALPTIVAGQSIFCHIKYILTIIFDLGELVYGDREGWYGGLGSNTGLATDVTQPISALSLLGSFSYHFTFVFDFRHASIFQSA